MVRGLEAYFGGRKGRGVVVRDRGGVGWGGLKPSACCVVREGFHFRDQIGYPLAPISPPHISQLTPYSTPPPNPTTHHRPGLPLTLAGSAPTVRLTTGPLEMTLGGVESDAALNATDGLWSADVGLEDDGLPEVPPGGGWGAGAGVCVRGGGGWEGRGGGCVRLDFGSMC